MVAKPVILVLVGFQFMYVSLALRFYVGPGETRCFTEELPSNSKITGEAKVASGKGENEIDLTISTMKGRVLYIKQGGELGKFSFQTPSVHQEEAEDMELDDYDYGDESGHDDDEDTYKICVRNTHQRPGRATHGSARSVSLRLNQAFGVESSTERVAKSTDTDRLLSAMRMMHTTLSGMIGDLNQLQRRERALTKRMKRTSGRLTFLAITSLVVMFAVCGLQYKYYQGYFKQKKLC